MAKKAAQPDWEINTKRTLKGIEEGIAATKQSQQLPDWARKYEEDSYAMAQQKYAREAEIYQKAAQDGYLVVDSVVNLPYTDCAGLYLSKFFAALRDEGKILANRCPQCQRVILPPRIVCSFCKIRVEDKDENWIELSDKGTVVSYTVTTEREVDRASGKVIGQYYPTAFIRLDGGDEWTMIAHFLGEPDIKKIHVGMQVQAVWRPRKERRARMTDIMYFRTIKE